MEKKQWRLVPIAPSNTSLMNVEDVASRLTFDPTRSHMHTEYENNSGVMWLGNTEFFVVRGKRQRLLQARSILLLLP